MKRETENIHRHGDAMHLRMKGGHWHVGSHHDRMMFARGLIIILSWAAGMSGCLAPDEINAIRAEMDKLADEIGVLHVKADTRIQTDGGDVNEPITGWILAIGYASVPVAFLFYLLAHRSSLFRNVKDRLRGKGGEIGRRTGLF